MSTTTDTVEGGRHQAVTYRNAGHVKARYGGVSDMTLWRWLHDDELGFPQPTRINGRRLWSEEALVAWERSRGMQAPDGEDEGDKAKPESEASVQQELKNKSGSRVPQAHTTVG